MDDQSTGPRPPARPPAVAHLAPHAAGPATRVRPNRPIRFTPSRTEPVPPPSPDAPSSREQPSLVGRFAAWVAIAIGWSIFVAWWAIVLSRESARSLGVALGLVAATLATSAILMSLWTWHNIRIAKKGKRGQSSMFIPMQWERDTLGRSLALPDDDAARTAAEVRVVLKNNVKTYVVPDGEEL